MTGVCCSTNKDTVLEAFEMLFNKRDYISAESFWSPDYIQHSAYIPGGRGGLFDFIKSLPATLRYENALATTEGDYVILHGRFSGHALARNWIVADIVRLQKWGPRRALGRNPERGNGSRVEERPAHVWPYFSTYRTTERSHPQRLTNNGIRSNRRLYE